MSGKPLSSILILHAAVLLIAGAAGGRADENRGLAQQRIGAGAGTAGKSPPTLPPAHAAARPDSAPGKAPANAAANVPAKSPRISSPKDLRSLIDQEGRPFSFADLAKKTVLVNFIFTSCPVKCPAQTQALIAIQRALPPALRPRVRFVSVTVDPERDSASVLKRYATAMGADLSGWSFVAGRESELNWLFRFYSVGVTALNDGQYDHQMGAYLIDAQGRVMQRYVGDIDKPRLLREIGEVDALNK